MMQLKLVETNQTYKLGAFDLVQNFNNTLFLCEIDC